MAGHLSIARWEMLNSVSEIKADLKAETEILRHQQNEIEQRYVALAQHL